MKTFDGPQSGARGDVVASRNHYGQHLRTRGRPGKRFTVARFQSDTAMRIVAGLAVLIGVGVGIYVAGLQMLRLPEFTLLTGKLVQRFRRS